MRSTRPRRKCGRSLWKTSRPWARRRPSDFWSGPRRIRKECARFPPARPLSTSSSGSSASCESGPHWPSKRRPDGSACSPRGPPWRASPLFRSTSSIRSRPSSIIASTTTSRSSTSRASAWTRTRPCWWIAPRSASMSAGRGDWASRASPRTTSAPSAWRMCGRMVALTSLCGCASPAHASSACSSGCSGRWTSGAASTRGRSEPLEALGSSWVALDPTVTSPSTARGATTIPPRAWTSSTTCRRLPRQVIWVVLRQCVLARSSRSVSGPSPTTRSASPWSARRARPRPRSCARPLRSHLM
mmetsp:Transcript_17994/g.63218  ORF Transcript_17994/g.63218 Transcript_17994/m.63218 type:complete len:301 (-) Transcript_17994:1759-2661(-)